MATEGTFKTIVLSVPGVGQWVWDESESAVVFYPRPHSTAHQPKPDEEFWCPLGSNNNAARALQVAAALMTGPTFVAKYNPGKRLKRFKDG